jgi:surface-anchored protein
MKSLLSVFVSCLLSAAALAQGSLPADQFEALTREHTDSPCVLYDAATSPPLSLVAWQRDAGLDLPTNQVIFVVREQARLTLPAGTPFGAAGAPFWILPQSQNVNLLYLGINVERVPSGVFSGPIAIQLKRFDGSGYFMVWQATGPGQYNIRINTRDGLGPVDHFQPLVGAHEHYNWGFSTTGVYSVTFQAVGRRIGETTNITSFESTFLFHVLPLPPPTNYTTWAKSHWPPGFNPPTTLTIGNPDGDSFDNLREYALGLSPTNANPITDAPQFTFIETGSQRYGALTFSRYLPALDLLCEPQVSGALPGGWVPLTNAHALEAGATNTVERVTRRDFLPAAHAAQRFYRLRPTLLPP